MTRPTYQSTITLGNLIQIATFLAAIAGAWFGIVNRMERLEQAQAFRDQQVAERLANLTGQIAAQGQQQAALERDTQRLRERLIAARVLKPE
jgi:hypothetical protein